MTVTIRHAKVEDAHIIAEAEREIAKEPGFFCSQPSELTDEKERMLLNQWHHSRQGEAL